MKKCCLLVVTMVMLVLAVGACRGGREPEATEAPPTATPTEVVEPTATPTQPPTETPEPTDTPEPTETPAPTQAAAPQIMLGELEGTWEPAIGTATLVQGAYEAILQTAEDIQAGQIDSVELSDQLVAQAVVLKALEDTLAGWDAPGNLAGYKQELEGYVAQAQRVLGQWLDDEITPAEVEGLLTGDLEGLTQMTQDILREANLDGLAIEDIEATLDRLAESLEENLDIEIVIPFP